MELGAEEASRVATLVKYNIMDSDAEEPFDRLAELAAELFHVPIAYVSLVDGYRQWFKSKVGLSADEMPRDWAFGARTIARKEIVVIADAAKDPEFAAAPAGARGPAVRFFAGAPLVTADGHALGAVCVVDRRARKPLSGHERRLLQHLADIAMEQIELRRGLKRIKTSVTKVARLAGGPAAATIVGECDHALDALQAVNDLTTRSGRKRPRLMTPRHGAKHTEGDDRRDTGERRERRERPRRA
jgi:GAF domain-containing protein